jgi:transposase
MLGEFGFVLPWVIRSRKALPEILSQQEKWDNRFIRLLSELTEELQALDERLNRYDRRLNQLAQEDERIRPSGDRRDWSGNRQRPGRRSG